MMKTFNNRIEGNDFIGYKSRIIASFVNEGGDLNSEKFDKYLDKLVELEWITEDDKDDIYNFITIGKLELETIAKEIIKEEK